MAFSNNNNRQKKSSTGSFSVFNFLTRSRKPRPHQPSSFPEDSHVSGTRSKVYPSDEDKGRYGVADPRIDTKASAFIAHFHATRVSESERQIFQAPA